MIDDSATLKMVDGEPLEFKITKEVKHPNVVNTLDFAVTNATREGSDSDGEERFDSANSRQRHHPRENETWVLLEFCDCGCLQVPALSASHCLPSVWACTPPLPPRPLLPSLSPCGDSALELTVSKWSMQNKPQGPRYERELN